MPDWWKKLFRDLEFLEQPICNANFEVVGRFDQVADFLWLGSGTNLATVVPIDSGQLQRVVGSTTAKSINWPSGREHTGPVDPSTAGLPDT